MIFVFFLFCNQKVEFTTGEEVESKEEGKKNILSTEELTKQLDRLLQDKANNQRIRDWVEVSLIQLLQLKEFHVLYAY